MRSVPRSAASKVIRVGRATVFAIGLAVVVAVVLGISSKALAGTGVGAVFNLGQNNAVNALSNLVGSTTSSMLRIDNNGTGSALQLLVEPNRPPMTVSAGAGKAVNLNADKLDGNNSTAFLPSEIYEKSAPGNIAADSSAGTTAYCDQGDVAVSGSYAMADAGAYLKVSSERRVDERLDGETGKVNPSGWHVIAQNTDTGAERSITVYVNCADRRPLHP